MFQTPLLGNVPYANCFTNCIWGGNQINSWNVMIKNCVFILTCLSFSHLQSTPHVIQYTYQDVFSTAQNSFWTPWFWCRLELLPYFVSPLPHQQNVYSRGIFSSGKTKNSLLGWDQVNREGGAQGSCCFWSKTAEHIAEWEDALVNHPSWNGQMHLKDS